MNRVLKRVIYTIGLIFLITVLILNIFFTSSMIQLEIVVVKTNNLISLISAILISILIFIICMVMNKNSKKIKKKYIFLGIAIYIYILAQIFIIKYKNAYPLEDQKTTYDLAAAMTNNSIEEFIDNSATYGGGVENRIYFERYQQQLPLAFIWSIIFRICKSTDFIIIQYFNIVFNVITVISVFLICGELSKKYSVNKYMAITLILTFVSIPLLVTFVYGDFSGLALSMLGTYFIMRYCRERKWRYLIFSIISVAFSYMLRMNSLIYIIAIVIYLLLDLLSNKEKAKVICTKITAIICFIILTFLPTILVKQYYVKNIGLDGSKSFPKLGYFLMGMSESLYSPGWYSYGCADHAYHDFEHANEKYLNLIKERLNYFKNNPSYTFKFYLIKLSSMWTENTHSSIRNKLKANKNYQIVYDGPNKGLTNLEVFLIIYQKALMFLIFGCSIIVLVQNRMNLSNEIILLLTIFIGGFLLHFILEAKSRYVIPYIVTLIPIASIVINKINLKIEKTLTFKKR